MSVHAQRELIAMSRGDPFKEKTHFERLNRVVRDIASFSVYAERLARHGYPTFAAPKAGLLNQNANNVVAEQAVVTMYFNNVRLAVPETAAEAMKLRKNDRVIRWREKIRAWEASLASGEINGDDIKAEIDEASGYIEGARGVRSALATVPLWLTFSLATLAKFAPALVVEAASGLAIVSQSLYALSALKVAASAIEASVSGPKPLKHEWLMIGPPKPSR